MNRWDRGGHLLGPLLVALLLLCWDLCGTCQALYIVEEHKLGRPPRYDMLPYELSSHQIKRSSVILDKMMYVLQKALHKNNNLENQTELRPNPPQRGDAEGKVYWRCYFNPVSCFRRR